MDYEITDNYDNYETMQNTVSSIKRCINQMPQFSSAEVEMASLNLHGDDNMYVGFKREAKIV